ncbi:MAG: hypothetical protein LBB47_00575, partial [Spirochaetaceae bacterium]|nr:hypothetical protein [Spirochaetaceae bacterium]
GTLDTSAGNVIVEEGGSVSVLSGKSVVPGGGAGTLKVADEDSVFNGETGADAATVLGTNKVWIGGTLKYTTGPFANVAALTVPFSYVGNGGTLDISDVTVPGSTPSTLVAAIPQGQNLIAKAAADEASTTTLSIPANADITLAATDTLATITGLTVSGTLNISGSALTLAAATATGVTTSGDGTIVSAGTALSPLLNKAGSALFVVQTVDVSFGADQTVKAGTTLISAEKITVAAAKTLTVEGTLNVEGTLALAAADSKVVIPAGGELTATAAGLLTGGSAALVTNVKLTVEASATTGTATKATNSGTGTTYILTTAAASDTTALITITAVGNAKWELTANTAVSAKAAEAASPAAPGTLKAGAGTTLILIGTA